MSTFNLSDWDNKLKKREERKSKLLVDDNPAQPNYEEAGPKDVKSTRRYNDILYVAGEGPAKAAIMVVTPALLSEDAVEFREGTNSSKLLQEKPAHFKGQNGVIFKDLLDGAGIPSEDVYFTSVVKWLLPRAKRVKPDTAALSWATPSFKEEINRVQPKIIICLGKAVFDILCDRKLRADDVKAGWFRSEEFNCLYILLDPVYLLAPRPDYIEKFRINLTEVKMMFDTVSGREVKRQPWNYSVITNLQELVTWVQFLKKNNHTLLAVDCEWAGINFIDGRLRSIQFCWDEENAVYIRFMDENMKYVFDVDYKTVGKVLGNWMDQPEVQYLGHHWAADAPWMHHVLGLKVFGKCIMDTEFAVQTCNEHDDLSLERLALKYTDFGRYDLELALWRKDNPTVEKDGFGRIPDKIIIPYGCIDVGVCMRAYPHILRDMQRQDVETYYYEIFHPFVTDVYVNFALEGLFINRDKLDELRELFLFGRDELDKRFRQRIANEAVVLLLQELMVLSEGKAIMSLATITKLVANQKYKEVSDECKKILGAKTFPKIIPFIGHTEIALADQFNIRSTPLMQRWLFEVKKFTPVKSTNQKEKGMPSLSWDKVLEMPKDVQALYTPSTDKQTLKIIAAQHRDATLEELLELNSIGNVLKAFLKPAEVDAEGEVVRENGLHYWIAQDGKIHYNLSATETGRPRAWKPNALNWPSYTNESIQKGLSKLLTDLNDRDILPPQFAKYLVLNKKGKLEASVPSIRSVVKAIDEWCFVESDFQTAEIRGLAFISGDENLIKLVTEDDTQFAFCKDESDEKVLVRIAYADYAGIPVERQLEKWLYSRKVGEEYVVVTPEELLRKEDGTLVHPRIDLHWSLAELLKQAPREELDKKVDRDGTGKVGNFSTSYGASPLTVERLIETATGVKPETGVGEKLLGALAERQPVATAFLEELQEAPKHQEFLLAQSGRKRRFLGGANKKLEYRTWNSIMSSQGREGRNYYMQESVASTSAKACKWLLDFYVRHKMQARPMMCLYDAVVTHCPMEERFLVAEAHEMFMHKLNTWEYHGRTLDYPIDTDFVYEWSAKLKEGNQLRVDLESPDYRNSACKFESALLELTELNNKLKEIEQYVA